MKKVAFLTFNDPPGGIYSSQVVDVCRFLRKEFNCSVQLIAFVSLKNFIETKQKILQSDPEAIVQPMFPGVNRWKMNKWMLNRALRNTGAGVVIARGAYAASLAMMCKEGRKICFDGRGAYKAELNEYNVIALADMQEEITQVEANVVNRADFRIAVSQALVDYWRKEYAYSSDRHVVIPCTLNAQNVRSMDRETRMKHRAQLGFAEDDCVIVYSGSVAGWQSLALMDEMLQPSFAANAKMKLLLLMPAMPDDLKLAGIFPDRVQQKWVAHHEVNNVLAACDYGWLVREQSVTNQVASPVKFAEYLAAGLQVIISENLGDYSELVLRERVGYCVSSGNLPAWRSLSDAERGNSVRVALDMLTKENYRTQYAEVIA